MSYLKPAPKDIPNIWKLRCCIKAMKDIRIGKSDPQPYREYHILVENGEFYKTYIVKTYRNYDRWRYLVVGDVLYNLKLKWEPKKGKVIIDADSKVIFLQHANFDKFYKKYVKKDPNINQTEIKFGD